MRWGWHWGREQMNGQDVSSMRGKEMWLWGNDKNLELHPVVSSESLYGIEREADNEHRFFPQGTVRQILGGGKPLGKWWGQLSRLCTQGSRAETAWRHAGQAGGCLSIQTHLPSLQRVFISLHFVVFQSLPDTWDPTLSPKKVREIFKRRKGKNREKDTKKEARKKEKEKSQQTVRVNMGMFADPT